MHNDDHNRRSSPKTSSSKKASSKEHKSLTHAKLKKAVIKNIKKYKGVLDILAKK